VVSKMGLSSCTRQLGQVGKRRVAKQYVKGRKSMGYLVCNSVAQDIIEAARGQHDEFVFVWRRERVKNLDEEPVMPYMHGLA
jgi:hypothetical protein